MKPKSLKLTAILLILMGSISSCNKSNSSDISSIWECIPESNVVITLTFDSQQGNVSVSTSPQELPTTSFYMFRDGDQYTVYGDTMYLVIPSIPDPAGVGIGFVRTVLSPDSMKLKYFGGRVLIGNLVTDYLFKRIK